LLIKKHKKSQIKADIVVEDTDEDKRLITGEVVADGDDQTPLGTTVIFGKYAIFPLTLQGEDYFFLDKNDVIGVCDYKE
jgi:co-chaperonin GroES (HSP10)